jgi:ubiquinone/menaquinone biosynthesis C-methylase UbiE
MLDGLRARMFNWSASRKGSQPDRIMSTLALKRGDRVAEIGSGGGYFALRFAAVVGPKGKVYCIDVNRAFLDLVASSARKAGRSNVVTVDASEMYSKLPKDGMDLVFLRSVYHHLDDRPNYFRKVAGLLRPGGRVAIIDYLPEARLMIGPPPGHRTAPETIIAEMRSAGYKVLGKQDFLATQAFVIFKVRKGH